MAEFRASQYTNRKGETKMTVSASVDAFKKLLNEDDELQQDFDDAVAEGLKNKPKAKTA